MSVTLVSFRDEIAGDMNKTTDFGFKKRLETKIIGYRATLLKQEFDKNGRYPSGSESEICIPMTQVKETECCSSGDDDCYVMRSTDKVPSPIRKNYNSDPFLFVGTANKEQSFSFIVPEIYESIRKGTRFIKNSSFYAYYNEYVYVFNNTGDKIAIRDPFSNPLQLLEVKDCSGLPCKKDVYIEDDLKRVVKQMIFEEFRALGIIPSNKEIKLNEEEQ